MAMEMETSFNDTNSNNDDDKDIEEESSNAESVVMSYKQHSSQILQIACPIILSEVFQNTMPVVDIAFVGSLPGTKDLAAAALATVWFNLWNTSMIGFLSAVDTYLAQAYGAKDYEAFRMWTGTSIVISAIATVFVCGVIALCYPAMVLLGQDEEISKKAGEFSYRLLPGLFPYFAFKVLTKYLQAQNILLPGIIVGLFANGMNILFNWMLIYKFDMGLNGAPWATTLTRLLECILILIYMYWYKDTTLAQTWPRFSRQSLEFKAYLYPFLKLAISGALAVSAEAWSFEVTSILAGLIGVIELDAHIITMTLAAFIYLSFPFAIGLAAAIKVGHLVGEGRGDDAKRSSIVAMALAVVIQGVLIAALIPLKYVLGDLFSSDEEVSHLVAILIPISCIFMIGDAVQSNISGTLRGLGRQKLVLLLNMLCFWIFGVPCGSLLTFVADYGVPGLWWGMVIGIYGASLVGIFILWFRIDWRKESERAKARIG